MGKSLTERDIVGTEENWAGFTVARVLTVVFLLAILGIGVWHAASRVSSDGENSEALPNGKSTSRQTREQLAGGGNIGREVAPEIDVATRRMVARSRASHAAKEQQARRMMELKRHLDAAKLRFEKACEFARRNRFNQAAQEELERRFENTRQAAVDAALEYRNFLMIEGLWSRWSLSRQVSLEDSILELEQMQYPSMQAGPDITDAGKGGDI